MLLATSFLGVNQLPRIEVRIARFTTVHNHPAWGSLAVTSLRGGRTDGESVLAHIIAGGGLFGNYELLLWRSGDGVDQPRFSGSVNVDKEALFYSMPCHEERVVGVGVDRTGLAGVQCGDVVSVLSIVPVDVHAVGGLIEDAKGEFVGGREKDFAGGGDGGFISMGEEGEE